jgi:predicted RNase H-like nuclease (RuvC/YqgF family)
VARKPKTFTREQVQSSKDKAVRFTRDVLGDPERAEEIEDESLDDYAARRHMQLSNPLHRSQRRHTTPRKTVEDYRAELADLKAEVEELEDENEDLQERLDKISDLTAGYNEEDEDDELTDDGDSDED